MCYLLFVFQILPYLNFDGTQSYSNSFILEVVLPVAQVGLGFGETFGRAEQNWSST